MTARIGTLPRKYVVRRWVATAVAGAVALVGFAVFAAFQSDASTTPVSPPVPASYVTATLPTTITPVAASVECTESDPCWNSCTMGDMSPCDGSAVLPYGARFHLNVTYNPGSGECWQGWVLTQVTVYVYGAGNRQLATSGVAVGCAPGGGDVFAGNGVGSMLPELYRQAASNL